MKPTRLAPLAALVAAAVAAADAPATRRQPVVARISMHSRPARRSASA